jgi:hypothetical protein
MESRKLGRKERLMLFIILSTVIIVAFLVIAHMAVKPGSFAGEAFAFQRYLGEQVSEECMSECIAKCSEKPLLAQDIETMPVIEAGPAAGEIEGCVKTGEGSGTNAPMCQRGARLRAISECSKEYSTVGCADIDKTWNAETRRCTVTVSCPNKK